MPWVTPPGVRILHIPPIRVTASGWLIVKEPELNKGGLGVLGCVFGFQPRGRCSIHLARAKYKAPSSTLIRILGFHPRESGLSPLGATNTGVTGSRNSGFEPLK